MENTKSGEYSVKAEPNLQQAWVEEVQNMYSEMGPVAREEIGKMVEELGRETEATLNNPQVFSQRGIASMLIMSALLSI